MDAQLPPVLLDRRVSDFAFRVYTWLEARQAHASHAEIARTFGKVWRSAQRAVDQLLELGYLSRDGFDNSLIVCSGNICSKSRTPSAPKAEPPLLQKQSPPDKNVASRARVRDILYTDSSSYEEPSSIVNKKYMYEGGVIRVTGQQVAQWQAAFPHVNVMGELSKLDAFLLSDEAKERQRTNWFMFVPNVLEKRNKQVLASKPQPPQLRAGTPKPSAMDIMLAHMETLKRDA